MRNLVSSRRSVLALVLSFLLFSLAAVLMFTRFGVFLVFDFASLWRETDNFNTLYTDAPIEITHVLDRSEDFELPRHIEQVSGIIARGDDVVLSTDQAEVFFLNLADPQMTSGGNLFPYTPLLLRQGSIESITQVGDENWLAGEYGVFVRADQTGKFVGTHPLPDALQSAEITGITWMDGIIFVTVDNTMALARVDIQTGESTAFLLDFSLISDQIIDNTTFLWSGVAYDSGRLYIVAENYPVIIIANAITGQVIETIGITGYQEYSDIAVSNGRIFLPSDHNYFDARPPVRIFRAPARS
ncbi:MAG: hypothetical protein ABJO09_09295 [Hyphomicrobiales bacterium]